MDRPLPQTGDRRRLPDLWRKAAAVYRTGPVAAGSDGPGGGKDIVKEVDGRMLTFHGYLARGAPGSIPDRFLSAASRSTTNLPRFRQKAAEWSDQSEPQRRIVTVSVGQQSGSAGHHTDDQRGYGLGPAVAAISRHP